MADLICPYNALLAQKNNFSCINADEVIRRGGSEYVCLQPTGHTICSEIHDLVKQSYLASQQLQDDLLSLPHSMFVKIQFGCILGLQSALGREAAMTEDVGSLITDAADNFASMDDLPLQTINEQITVYKPQRHGKRAG